MKGRGKENYVKANETIQKMVIWTKVVVVEWLRISYLPDIL